MKKILLILILLPSLSYAQGVSHTNIALYNSNGNARIVPSAVITVCAANNTSIPCSAPLASTLFKDFLLSVPITNPFNADFNGNYTFMAAPGNYTVTMTGVGITGSTYQLSLIGPSVGTPNTWTALQTFSGGVGGLRVGFQQFTSSGTWTIPAGVTSTKATAIGCGGAGGGSDGTHTGSPGASAGVAIKYLTNLIPGNTLTVTLCTVATGVSAGTGQTGGSVSISSGTQVISTITANGGGGGVASTGIDGGGIGGTATGGDINLQGSRGVSLLSLTAGAQGGATPLFGSLTPVTVNAAGAPGINPGNGGGGAQGTGPFAGGNGGPPLVIFEWVY